MSNEADKNPISQETEAAATAALQNLRIYETPLGSKEADGTTPVAFDQEQANADKIVGDQPALEQAQAAADTANTDATDAPSVLSADQESDNTFTNTTIPHDNTNVTNEEAQLATDIATEQALHTKIDDDDTNAVNAATSTSDNDAVTKLQEELGDDSALLAKDHAAANPVGNITVSGGTEVPAVTPTDLVAPATDIVEAAGVDSGNNDGVHA